MAFGNGDSNMRKKKKDGIMELNGQINDKVDALTERVDKNCSNIETILKKLDDNCNPPELGEEFRALHEEYASLRREMQYIATQNERIFIELSSQIKQLADAIGSAAPASPAQQNFEELVDKVVNKLGSVKTDEYDVVIDEDGCAAIADAVAKKLHLQKPATCDNSDYDVVIDEDGLNKITQTVSTEVCKTTNARFEVIEQQLSEIKELLADGVEVKGETVERTEVSTVEEPLIVTVSDVTQDEPENYEQQELAEEIAELVAEIDEIPAEGEIDEFEEASDGVDFANMMRYNRSFIARIIQSTEDQKEYYGTVKTALLSYAKVNSNVAWGAERFNKGRETIARFKIRGKTLCLYLALDPKEFEYSVYHQIDVSDNKSMHGTPMMVKIKSPRGVKKAIRLIDELLARRNGVKRNKIIERDYAAMYPYETMEELIEDGLVKDVSKK